MVPMRDGVHLATDVYRPTVNGEPVQGKLPLLLQRTPYNKEGSQLVQQARHSQVTATSWRSRTIVAPIIQKASRLSTRLRQDGYDAIEFLAQLPYTDGQVGMWGTSYAGHTQASAAIAHPPHLKTVVINCGGLNNGWGYKIRNHGAFELAQQVGWAFGQLAAQTNNAVAHDAFQREKAVDWIGDLHGKRGQTPLSLAPNFEDYIFDIMTRSDYDQSGDSPTSIGLSPSTRRRTFRCSTFPDVRLVSIGHDQELHRIIKDQEVAGAVAHRSMDAWRQYALIFWRCRVWAGCRDQGLRYGLPPAVVRSFLER